MTEAIGHVSEYLSRQRMAKLGFVTSTANISAEKAAIFDIIACEIDKTQADEVRSKRNGRR